MKSSAITTLSWAFLLMGVPASCKGNPEVVSETNATDVASKGKQEITQNRIKLTIGAKTFSATLTDNPTSSTFKAMLPLSVEMSDLHGNEKFFHLPSRLPSHDANPGTIQTGDLMLWSSKTVVLFYKTFPTSYGYTKLGRVDDPEGLPAAVGSGNVTIKFELE